MNTPSRALLVVCLTVLAAAAAPAAAPPHELSMDQAVKNVEQQYHARVVKAEAQHSDGRTTYVLKLLNDAGKVWTVRVDAASGAVQ
jgi:uncharacterized membrane protein YkoI